MEKKNPSACWNLTEELEQYQYDAPFSEEPIHASLLPVQGKEKKVKITEKEYLDDLPDDIF